MAHRSDGADCLLPWQIIIRPSPRQKLIIDAHRDDWP
jgi:hypothetical protein